MLNEKLLNLLPKKAQQEISLRLPAYLANDFEKIMQFFLEDVAKAFDELHSFFEKQYTDGKFEIPGPGGSNSSPIYVNKERLDKLQELFIEYVIARKLQPIALYARLQNLLDKIYTLDNEIYFYQFHNMFLGLPNVNSTFLSVGFVVAEEINAIKSSSRHLLFPMVNSLDGSIDPVTFVVLIANNVYPMGVATSQLSSAHNYFYKTRLSFYLHDGEHFDLFNENLAALPNAEKFLEDLKHQCEQLNNVSSNENIKFFITIFIYIHELILKSKVTTMQDIIDALPTPSYPLEQSYLNMKLPEIAINFHSVDLKFLLREAGIDIPKLSRTKPHERVNNLVLIGMLRLIFDLFKKIPSFAHSIGCELNDENLRILLKSIHSLNKKCTQNDYDSQTLYAAWNEQFLSLEEDIKSCLNQQKISTLKTGIYYRDNQVLSRKIVEAGAVETEDDAMLQGYKIVQG